jgi:hypothetical protein
LFSGVRSITTAAARRCVTDVGDSDMKAILREKLRPYNLALQLNT